MFFVFPEVNHRATRRLFSLFALRMGTGEDRYETVEGRTEATVEYSFTSKGRLTIKKVVRYRYTQIIYGRQIFNMEFGDYDVKENNIVYDRSSNNGDAYRVFHTVLNTIPAFFRALPSAMIMIEGIDSSLAFEEKCRKDCRRNCTIECKRLDRRIRIYREFLNKDFDELRMDYFFWGGIRNDNSVLVEPYGTGENYNVILIEKK